MSLDFAAVRAAAARIAGIAHRTPVVTSRTLDERAGAQVFLKCENLQRMGAFKFRGAYNALSSLSPEEQARGVVAFSSGNHAQGVALAANLLGIRATIVMPADAPASKRHATRGYGAQVVSYDRATEDRDAIAARIAAETGATVIPPYDHTDIIAGAGTAALELLDETGSLDAIVVNVGGGGLLAGTCLAAHGIDTRIAVWGVEPEAGDDFAQSLAKGGRVKIPVPQTIADGQQTQSPGALTFPIAQGHAAGIVTVTDDELRAAMRFAFERLKLVVEPSGSAGLAAILTNRLPKRYARIGIILTGGNIDADRFAQLLAGDVCD
ncbi:MAG: threo-3-hydroxy-L-aspartate ammonia-lyase [Candidatus Eremiobacteraeota bacterium]|nr:threo-3-hydroxy-L-aspartate ammonia-lyase [Candidatus Eremiobacteraeota bacterium]